LRRPKFVALLVAPTLAAAVAGCGGGQGATLKPAGPRVPNASTIDRGSFSPDGKTLAYRGVTKGEFARVGVGVTRGGGPRWITPTGIDATAMTAAYRAPANGRLDIRV